MGRVFLSNKTVTCLASPVHIAEDSMKTLHIKYKNLLHIYPLTTVCTLQRVPRSKSSPCTSQAAWIHGRGAEGQTVLTQCDCCQITWPRLFSSFSLVNTQGKGGRGEPGGLVAVRFSVQVNWITGRHTAIRNWDTNSKETAALSPPKRQCYTVIVLTNCQTSGTSFPCIDRFMKMYR